MPARLGGDRRPLVLIVVGVALLVGFVIVVAPLFNTSGAPAAELDGVLPSQAVAGQPLEADIGMDNTGVSIIRRVCVEAKLQGPLQAIAVVFQGLDHETFSNGAACGGSLSGGETISLRVLLRATGAGTALLSLTPADGGHVIGSAFSTAVHVSAAR